MAQYYGVVRSDESLAHYGVKGMRWGVRKKQPSGEVLFVSGSSKTQDKNSPYYRRHLPGMVKRAIKASIKNRDTIIVGDAPGIDRQTQNYLKKKHYSNVEVYGPGTKVRYSANPKWKTHPINDPDHEVGSPEWLAKKDRAMTDRATRGLAVILDEGSRATRNNVQRLVDQKKKTRIYELANSWDHPYKPLIRGFKDPGDQEVIGPYSVHGPNGPWQYSGVKHSRKARGKL